LGPLKKGSGLSLPPGLGPGGPGPAKLRGGLAGLKLGGMGPLTKKKNEEKKGEDKKTDEAQEEEQKKARKPPKPRPSAD
jgi:hypothetical protein